ncbi:MAG: bifunctional enzyme CysN/CysC [Planctomycetota bacterium]|jgi:bifunctional enzyme CysN/CysC
MTFSTQLDDLGIEKYLEKYGEREMLKLLTCGSVDDGKSTLIGRLLYDSEQVHDDVLEATTKASDKFGTTGKQVDLALLVDGLQAEREQGITIDVAYRYFATDRRKFVMADTPGHVQYTRNMATGASSCDLAVILIDARQGVLEQTHRHSFICSLLGIKHFVVAINKMDLVDYSQERFEEIRAAYTEFAARLQVPDIHFIPMSALVGENVVHRGASMPWFQGSPLLDHLETVHVGSDRNLMDLRFPVQNVLRPNLDFRGYSGTLASGVVRVGDKITALPSGKQSTVKSIETYDGQLEVAFAPMAIVMTLNDEIDISRGDMIAAPNNAPTLTNGVEAMLVWFNEEPMKPGANYLIKHTTAQTSATITDLRYRINVASMHRETVPELAMNEVGRVHLDCARPLAVDAYTKNHGTGSFILIDRMTNATVAAGMIVERKIAEDALKRRTDSHDAGSNVRLQDKRKVSTELRQQRLSQKPFVLWITGLPRSGKSSIAYELEQRLFDQKKFVQVLDGEILRLGLNRDLGFNGADRWENQRRAAELARLNMSMGVSTVIALVSPLGFERQQAREIVGDGFLEVFCSASLEACEGRDTHDLYKRARAGEIANVTGIDAPYEEPIKAEIVLDTVNESLDANVQKILDHLSNSGLLKS